ncbi:MAG: ATP synthase F0 subunit B [Deltaproteobacteria bacterium]|nr:ATP synthase F0 subunit B [Deltaproteobacteria bacterium]
MKFNTHLKVWSLNIFAILLFAPALTLASSSHTGEFHINWWHWDLLTPPVGWYIIDFLIFVSLLIFFTKGPLKKGFSSRHQSISQAVIANDNAFTAAKNEYETTRNKLAAVESEALQLCTRVKEGGAAISERIITDGRAYALRLREDVKEIISQETQRSRERLQRTLSLQVLETTEKILINNITAADRQRMIDNALRDFDNFDWLVKQPAKREIS